jgi:hypothetical protein
MPKILNTTAIPANDPGRNSVVSKPDNSDAQDLGIVGERSFINEIFNMKTIIFSQSEDV